MSKIHLTHHQYRTYTAQDIYDELLSSGMNKTVWYERARKNPSNAYLGVNAL
jgi:hypothetical protein